MKKRVVGYDIIKSMAMFFVVMLHYSFYTRFYSSGLAGTAVTVLCVVCVPLFFAVNGALLLPRKMDETKHYRKTLNIVIKISEIFRAAVCATMISCPSLLIAVWSVSEPILTSELIKPIDSPDPSMFFIIAVSASRKSSRTRRSISYRLNM